MMPPERALIHADNYCLYRVFEFDPATGTGKTFVVKGNIGMQPQLAPTNFRVGI